MLLFHQLDAALREPLLEDLHVRSRLVGQDFLDLIAEPPLESGHRRAVAAVLPRQRLIALAALDHRQLHLAHQAVVRLGDLVMCGVAKRFTCFVVVVDDLDVRVGAPARRVDVSHHQCIAVGKMALRKCVSQIIDRLHIAGFRHIELIGVEAVDDADDFDLPTVSRSHSLGALDECLSARQVTRNRRGPVRSRRQMPLAHLRTRTTAQVILDG
nr:hypothetical protein [Corynebacterium freneyi]